MGSFDPCPGQPKQLYVEYTYGGRRYEVPLFFFFFLINKRTSKKAGQKYIRIRAKNDAKLFNETCAKVKPRKNRARRRPLYDILLPLLYVHQ